MAKRPTTSWVNPLAGVTAETGWSPRADVYQSPDEVLVRMELPGVSRHHVAVNFNPGRHVLTVRGERRAALRLNRQRVVAHQIEIEDGSFAREINLPDLPLDVAATEAFWEDGVLQLRIPIVRARTGRMVVETWTISHDDE